MPTEQNNLQANNRPSGPTEKGEARITLIRRQTGVEIHVDGVVRCVGGACVDIETIAQTFLDVISYVDGTSGYGNRRELTDEDKAARRAFAINRAKRAKST